MQHFAHVSADERQRLFHQQPQPFDRNDEREVLATALGATLYIPCTRPTLVRDVRRVAAEGCVSVVLCLEDSVPDPEVPAAEANLVAALHELAEDDEWPLLFVRVRTPEQLTDIVDRAGSASHVLTGFALPKFLGERAWAFMDANAAASAGAGRQFRVMPILESPELAFHEQRSKALAEVRSVLDAYDNAVLCLRIGATDLSGAFGLRRSYEFTIYDIRVVSETISAVINEFGRTDGSYVISGPVWEYFGHHERIFRPQLRRTPFVQEHATALRAELLEGDIDGLLKEVSLDHANGLMGKTVIHPRHIAPVHALSVVTLEQWTDAQSTLQAVSGGVQSSQYKNKMNESKPHLGWAQRIMRRAAAFGVARDVTTFVDLLRAGDRQ